MKSELVTNVRHTTPYRIHSEDDLLQAFRLKDQKYVVVSQGITFPLDVQYYFNWLEPSGNYVFLVYKRPNWDGPRGLVFRRTHNYLATANLCDWCHAYGSSDQVSMLSVRVDSKLTIGQYLCSDLSCLQKLETQIGVAGKNFDTLAEQLCERINRFYERTIMAPKN